MTESKTHRCIDCAQRVEHYQTDLCPSCGRCIDHCQGDMSVKKYDDSLRQGDHLFMRKIGEDA